MNRTAENPEAGRVARAIELDRKSPIPLYLQIKQVLARRIALWGSRTEKFFTDGELCRMFGVSRMTVRQAVQELVDEGVLKRSRGIGTFVVNLAEAQGTPDAGFRERWQEQGQEMSIEVIGFDTRPCPAAIAEALGIAVSAPVRYFMRLRRAGPVPIALDHRYIPSELAVGYTQAEAARSVLETLWKRFELDYGAARIEAMTAGQEEARWLGVAPGSALLLRRIRYIDRTGRPVVAGYSVDRGDLVRYSVHIPLVRETIEPLTRGRRSDRVVRLRWEVAPPEAAEH